MKGLLISIGKAAEQEKRIHLRERCVIKRTKMGDYKDCFPALLDQSCKFREILSKQKLLHPMNTNFEESHRLLGVDR